MEMTFEKAVEIVLRKEGGYVNNPHDPGSETKFGISKRAYPHLDIMELTRDEAKEIYRKDYWEKIRADEMPSSLRLIYFDAAVNQGVPAAIKMLQETVGVKQDGIIGIQTMAFVNNMDSPELVFAYAMARHNRYIKNKNWDVFGRGWSWRLLEIVMLSFAKRTRFHV